jgi:hypothetical protein
MHPSYFLLLQAADNDSGKELRLPSDTSEWLFHVGFWDEFNKRHQTQFAQYEEEVLPKNLTPDLTASVKALIDQLAGQSATDIRFLYGWDANKNGIYCTVSSRALSESLARLLEFLGHTKELDSEVYCQL